METEAPHDRSLTPGSLVQRRSSRWPSSMEDSHPLRTAPLSSDAGRLIVDVPVLFTASRHVNDAISN